MTKEINFEQVESLENMPISARLARAQAEMPQPVFDSVNPHFKSKYASLRAIVDSVVPSLNKYGLFVAQPVTYDNDKLWVETMVYADNGAGITLGRYPVIFGDVQKTGAAITYAKRYALSAAFLRCADEDTDGETPSYEFECSNCGNRVKASSREELSRVRCCDHPALKVCK